jgi:hypothetical protein
MTNSSAAAIVRVDAYAGSQELEERVERHQLSVRARVQHLTADPPRHDPSRPRCARRNIGRDCPSRSPHRNLQPPSRVPGVRGKEWAETFGEDSLFVADESHVQDCGEQRGNEEGRNGAEQQCDTRTRRDHAQIHGIPAVAKHAVGNDNRRRPVGVDRGATALELLVAEDVQEEADDEWHEAEVAPGRGHNPPPRPPADRSGAAARPGRWPEEEAPAGRREAHLRGIQIASSDLPFSRTSS